MPLAPLGLDLLEVPPHANPFSSRSWFPPAVGWVLAPRPSPRPKPPNQLLPPGFSATLSQRRTPDFRDFPSRESVRPLVVLPTVRGRSSSRFPTHEHPSGSHGRPSRLVTSTAIAQLRPKPAPSPRRRGREVGVTCRADSLRNLLGEPQHSHRPPSVCRGWSSSDKPRLIHRNKTLEVQSLSAFEAPCEVPSTLGNQSLQTFSRLGTRLNCPGRSRSCPFAPRPRVAVACLAGSLRNLFGNPQRGPPPTQCRPPMALLGRAESGLPCPCTGNRAAENAVHLLRGSRGARQLRVPRSSLDIQRWLPLAETV